MILKHHKMSTYRAGRGSGPGGGVLEGIDKLRKKGKGIRTGATRRRDKAKGFALEGFAYLLIFIVIVVIIILVILQLMVFLGGNGTEETEIRYHR